MAISVENIDCLKTINAQKFGERKPRKKQLQVQLLRVRPPMNIELRLVLFNRPELFGLVQQKLDI